MPVTLNFFTRPFPVQVQQRLTSPAELISTDDADDQSPKARRILQSSFGREGFEACESVPNVLLQKNGFVNTVITAYNDHHNLILRPDDAWIAILGQFNIYVNHHAEELREHFVAHEGKQTLVIVGGGTRETADFDSMSQQMTDLIQKNVIDPELQQWILPNFSTTTSNDMTVCSVIMMSTLKAYFGYENHLLCGLPSVTLEGTKDDWSSLLSRIDKLPTFGVEPKAWASLLRPILTRFVRAFDGEVDTNFWGRICHQYTLGSGPEYISGWITAFAVWDNEGNWNGFKPAPSRSSEDFFYDPPPEATKALKLDGVVYPTLFDEDVPTATCQVDVKLNDGGTVFECEMFAGLVGSIVKGDREDVLAPLPAWFMVYKETD